jgi:hypothetical protein
MIVVHNAAAFLSERFVPGGNRHGAECGTDLFLPVAVPVRGQRRYPRLPRKLSFPLLRQHVPSVSHSEKLIAMLGQGRAARKRAAFLGMPFVIFGLLHG